MAASTNEETLWPPPSGLSTPIVSREDAILTTAASIEIAAPAAIVFSLVVDTASYPSWCSFVPRVTIKSQPEGTPSISKKLENGTHFTYHVVMDPSKPTKEVATHLVVTDVSTPDGPSSYIPSDVLTNDPSYTADLSKVYRISWKGDGGFFARGLRTERFHEIIATGPDSCEVRTWELMGGVLARSVKWMYKETLSKRYQDWVEDLKKACEDKVREANRDVAPA